MALSLLPQAKRCPVPSSAAVISAAAVGALKQKLSFCSSSNITWCLDASLWCHWERRWLLTLWKWCLVALSPSAAIWSRWMVVS